MLFNKNQMREVNCKKVLHKVGKFWVTVSIVSLGLIGTKMTTAHLNANADSSLNNNNVNHQISTHSANSSESNNIDLSRNNSAYIYNLHSTSNSAKATAAQTLQMSHNLSRNQNNSVNTNINLDHRSRTYLKNNEAYNLNSFTRLDGFLTANSWYRPRLIHKNGQKWVNSAPSDYRPLLMNWWPDMNTQLAYLNFMQKRGYLPAVYNGSHNLNNLEHADESVQDNIERQITKVGNTQWLHDLMNSFIATQPQWNKQSEDPQNDTLQGGYLAFHNNKLTPDVNSPWRLIGRSGSNKDRHNNNYNNLEFLLGNDIDNSNPKVQAEDLNNIYYINKLGTLNGNSNADFDGFREDATGSMDYDVTDLLSRYVKDRYNLNNDKAADAHLNILEDASSFKQDIKNNEALHQDEGMLFNLRSTLFNPLKNRTGSLSDLGGNDNGDLNFYHVDDNSDYNTDNANPNYSRVNLHDNDSFIQPITRMAKQLMAENPNMTPYTAVEKSAKKFDDGMFQAIKPYGEYYNLPAGYAYLLTNKDTVPEVYYGDMYVGYKPYMSTKTPYYDAIDALLKARVKYVAGGQQMSTHNVDNNEYETSVRFGKIIKGDKAGQAISSADQYPNKYFAPSTTGIAVVMGNNPSAKPTDSLTVSMGVNHANQEYHPLLLSNRHGISINSASISLRTDNQGNLEIPAKYLQGVLNPQVSGNLSVWVPNGASANQDARTQASSAIRHDGKVYHQNAALDSHVLYESFSPFMPINAPRSEQLDTKIETPESTQLLKNWGITDFRFPPHYNPLKHDNSFIDAVDQNGYAFQDRYDFDNTKYGSQNDLLNANVNLHNAGIHTLADLVLNQVYDLPRTQVVSVDRTNYFDEYVPLSRINGQLYADKTISGTNEKQFQYGGKYLDSLMKDPKYHDLFTTKQVSTGQTIDPNTKIRQWSAKYMNGSNIQHRGIGYVLQNPNTKQYYRNDLAPEVFINGIPTNLENDAPIDFNTMNANLALAKQKASKTVSEIGTQDSLANSDARSDNRDSKLISDASQVNSYSNQANNESVNVDSLTSQARSEVSLANSASSVANSYAEAEDNVNTSASGIGLNSTVDDSGNISNGANVSLTSDYASAMSAYQNDLSAADSNALAASSDADVNQSLSNNVLSLVKQMNSLSSSDSVANSASNSSSNGSNSSSSNSGSSNNNSFYDSLINSIQAASASLSAAQSAASSYEQRLLGSIAAQSASSRAETTSEEESEIKNDQVLFSTENSEAQKNLNDLSRKHDRQTSRMAKYDRTLMSELASGVSADAASPNSFTTDNADKATALAASVVGNTYHLLSDANSSAASVAHSISHKMSSHRGYNMNTNAHNSNRLSRNMDQNNENMGNHNELSSYASKGTTSHRHATRLPQTGEIYSGSKTMALVLLSILSGVMAGALDKHRYLS